MTVLRRLVVALIAMPAVLVGIVASGGCSQPADDHATNAAPAIVDGPAGRWSLQDGDSRLQLDLQRDGEHWAGQLGLEGDDSHAVSHVDWHPDSALLRFRRGATPPHRWYHGRVVDGVFVGRAGPGDADQPPSASMLADVVTGWHAPHFEQALLPRSWDLQLADRRLARVRIDQAEGADAPVGTFKVFASLDTHSNAEELQYPLHDIHWDGRQLRFQREVDGAIEQFSADSDGRHLRGQLQRDGEAAQAWTGTRAELLGYGLTARDTAARSRWQAQTRARLAHLIMAGAPTPLRTQVNVLRADLPPRTSTTLDPARDDDGNRWPQAYRLDELELLHDIEDPLTGTVLTRRNHGYLARPDGLAAGEKRPAVVVLNGHAGSAWQMFDPATPMYWYGDAFARRGYVVLALDVSHREYGDDPEGGNITQPANATNGQSSMWEEDGERTWDAREAVEYLRRHSDVDPQRISVAGLSMGAEIAIQVAAIHPGVNALVASGYVPDFQVMRWNGNHECWQWLNADINEYVDMATYLALVAPRVAIVQSGAQDFTFSRHHPPFSADRQVMQRARHAWLDQGAHLIHLLQPDGHGFKAGSTTGGVHQFSRQADGTGVDAAWQTDGRSESLEMDLFQLLDTIE